MFNKIKQAFSDISDSEKLYLALIFLGLFFAVILVLMAIAVSRGNDVDYFKDRLYFLEHRFNVAEKARDGLQYRMAEEEKKTIEINQKIVELHNKVADTERWIEEYNKLPHLPKPKPIKSQPLRPLNKE